MKTTIKMNDGQALELSANAATPVRFKMTFGKDLLTGLRDINSIDDIDKAEDVIPKLTYVMNMQALGETDTLSPINFLNWLEEFSDPMTFSMLANDIISFYLSNVKTESKPKKARGPRNAK